MSEEKKSKGKQGYAEYPRKYNKLGEPEADHDPLPKSKKKD